MEPLFQGKLWVEGGTAPLDRRTGTVDLVP